MATFTTRLKDVLDRHDDIGLNDYPIFDESHREVLNQKIINQYWNQEICMENVSTWTHGMKRKMAQIMPFYNEHYKLSAIEIDALSTADFKSHSTNNTTGTNSGEGSNESLSDSKSRSVASDTPQTSLQDDADYATAMQDNISGTTATGLTKQSETSLQDGVSDNTMTGYQGHQPELILRARQTLVNIDVMVIEELAVMFMSITSTGDDFVSDIRKVWNNGTW